MKYLGLEYLIPGAVFFALSTRAIILDHPTKDDIVWSLTSAACSGWWFGTWWSRPKEIRG